ncbi:ABC transporter ATP-binding protein [Mangrovimonas sp. AS39]|uniref:ABC transporter ATP-binding protein n=1 Tax=Mangrovimonas futianensis TaxID=2895523 RepID=UPI001E59FAB1|nr:ABC transporter ATP-binding protein [Mangrovimonas futianensis]MCF1191243.1 ABC transporter ATP-binding protein [Mangrovimonas futianensis]MCF1194938.1 ABC transporter ATP-binding protein [Mangrovimonas futianensis]
MSQVILKAENISKQYRLGTVGTGTLSHDLNRWWHRLRGKEDPYLKVGSVNDRSTEADSDYVWALQDINFEVQQGEVLGIIGKNGAGKSTLLKILSRVTSPTTGEIKTRGRIASLLEVGTGFHPELTGRENIYLNGAILGMTKKEIRAKEAEIIDFSGCARYVDTPVKRYSSGMRVRLAFAVAAFLEPDILVIDEVLAVGDAEFQKKAIGKMQDISKGEGRTVLFVSHNMAAVKSLCTRGIVLEHGKTVFEGGTDDAVDFYLNETKDKSKSYLSNRIEANENYIKSIKIVTSKNGFHEFNKDLKVEITIHCAEKIQEPAVSYQIINNDNIPLIHELVLYNEQNFGENNGVYKLSSLIKNIKLYEGEYGLNVFFADNFSKITYDRLFEVCHFEIINSDKRPYYWQKGSAIYKENDTEWFIYKIDKNNVK